MVYKVSAIIQEFLIIDDYFYFQFDRDKSFNARKVYLNADELHRAWGEAFFNFYTDYVFFARSLFQFPIQRCSTSSIINWATSDTYWINLLLTIYTKKYKSYLHNVLFTQIFF